MTDSTNPGFLVVGVDPGVTTGLLAAVWRHGRLVPPPVAAQVHGHQAVEPFVVGLLDSLADPAGRSVLAVEAFVVSTRAARSGTAFAGRLTRQLIATLSDLTERTAVEFVTRNAATVKPWATDRRLELAGLADATAGMHHARDAARHALYAAVHANIARDPLSSRAVR